MSDQRTTYYSISREPARRQPTMASSLLKQRLAAISSSLRPVTAGLDEFFAPSFDMAWQSQSTGLPTSVGISVVVDRALYARSLRGGQKLSQT